MAKTKINYPKTLFVLRVNAGTDDEFLQATTDLDDLVLETGQKALVGIYILQKSGTVDGLIVVENSTRIV